jgi:hypothetical protein
MTATNPPLVKTDTATIFVNAERDGKRRSRRGPTEGKAEAATAALLTR